MTYTAPNARAFARKQGSLAEKITSELSSIDAEMEALSSGLDGSNVANTSPDNVIGAIPVLYRIAVEDASANNDITSTHKFLVTDFWFVGGATPGVAEDTVQLLNGTNAISEAVAKTTDANCLVRATQLDQSTGMVAAGGTIRITSVKNTNVAGTAYVMGIRVA